METIKKVDPNSTEFRDEFQKTVAFTDKVLKQFGFVYNPDNEVNQSVQFGLTRNKLIYNKRYCPCFFVTGNKEEDRVCPCKPALDHEIKNDGHCHCGIFCTPEYAMANQKLEEIEEVAHTHSRGLSVSECQTLLNKSVIDSDELQALLEAREEGTISFLLIDNREWMEWSRGHIAGTDYLIPTTSFYQSVEVINDKKEIPIVVYCHSGSRSAYCQNALKDLGFSSVTNLSFGITGWRGDIIRGE